MKKHIYIVLFGLLLSMGVVSCDNNTDLLFDETAAQRKESANKAYDDALKSSEQGWLFQYYPEETQKYGGYNFVVKFAEDNQVTVWSENMADFTQPETSTYNIISYGGPVLTFDTYNSIMHEFATPSADEYLAKGGDFEFLIMSNENDVMTVKGIKTGNELILTKMTESPEVYLEKINAISKLFKGSSLESTINDIDMTMGLNDHRLTFNFTENEEVKSVKAAFIVTPTGISFYEPITILGITVNSLTANLETNQLISEDGKIVIDIIQAPIDLTANIWSIETSVETDRSEAVKNAWDAANSANAFPYPLGTRMFLGKSTLAGEAPSLSLTIAPYWVQYNLSFGGVKGQPNYVSINKLQGGVNWSFVPFFDPLVDFIVGNAPYSVEIDNKDNPTQVKMTSAANPEVWFILR
ncbi:DUF4302 domain-containing protein [Ancylomarina salipaludis]|uniref:DUF4302 domain-containing protein n=1 Tax=Ancylomarina salipaludis TaxID=2501299 RepID=A0A4Q1JK49_9BACT|nr:DUF4302 domain-containing protein [Ancylomarina salipaludis]RXQ92930.1 DUF4302 domain-containing protein [Ancylomarina salipaludis]